MFSTKDIKSMVLSLGADKCWIAGSDMFTDAPAGFMPTKSIQNVSL
jgi:hypothetical protein